MFCRCFCPGTLSERKGDIRIVFNEREYLLEDVVIMKCQNQACRDGTIPKETWAYITGIVGSVPEGSIEAFRLARSIFSAFRSNE